MVSCAAVDAPLARLDDLPRGTWLPGLINGCGVPSSRLELLHALREALLAGRLPDEGDANCAFAQPFNQYFREATGLLELPRFARDKPDTADQVLRTLLWHMDRIANYRDEYGESLHQASLRAGEAYTAEWADTVETWTELYAIFDSIGGLDLAAEPSAMKGVLARAGWAAVKVAHAMIQDLPALRAMILTLGRSVPRPLEETEAREPVSVTELEDTRIEVMRPAPVNQQGAEIESIHRSADIAAMLPTEAVLRRRRVLKQLWRARYVEQALLTYDRRVTLDAPIPETMPQRKTRIVMQPPPQFDTGPIIVCVDTSSSMQGAKEWLVKATVFEAMRVAHAQKRACYLYAFSDETSLSEHALTLDVDGLHALVDFMELAFHGGTDIAEPITRAVERVRDEAWRAADILIASDGEFGVTPAVSAMIAEAKEHLHLRIQGVLAGDRESIGIRQICDDNLWLKDWRRFEVAGDLARSPVHSKSLTAMYFPNALRT
jgi:uncharacterized protein with von Willebrand factor type A (vWA) domain